MGGQGEKNNMDKSVEPQASALAAVLSTGCDKDETSGSLEMATMSNENIVSSLGNEQLPVGGSAQRESLVVTSSSSQIMDNEGLPVARVQFKRRKRRRRRRLKSGERRINNNSKSIIISRKFNNNKRVIHSPSKVKLPLILLLFHLTSAILFLYLAAERWPLITSAQQQQQQQQENHYFRSERQLSSSSSSSSLVLVASPLNRVISQQQEEQRKQQQLDPEHEQEVAINNKANALINGRVADRRLSSARKVAQDDNRKREAEVKGYTKRTPEREEDEDDDDDDYADQVDASGSDAQRHAPELSHDGQLAAQQIAAHAEDPAQRTGGAMRATSTEGMSKPEVAPDEVVAKGSRAKRRALTTGYLVNNPPPNDHNNQQVQTANNSVNLSRQHIEVQRRLMELRQKWENIWAISDAAYYTLLVVYSLFILIGGISNSLICLTVILKPKILSPRNIFILNLAGSDLLLCLFTMPFSFIQISMKIWKMGLITCKLVAGLQATSIFVSTISITAIAVDRYRVIVYPTHQGSNGGTKQAALMLSLVWIFALILSLPLFYYRTIEHPNIEPQIKAAIGANFSPIGFCGELWPLKHGRGIYSVISMLAQYVVPITIVSVVYAKISDKLQKRLIRRQRLTQLECQQKRQLNLIKRTHTMLISVSLIFGLSWLPLNLLNVIGDFSGSGLFKDDELFRLVFAVCHLIGCSSACTNPILYGYLNENFRKEFIQVYGHHARKLINLWRGSGAAGSNNNPYNSATSVYCMPQVGGAGGGGDDESGSSSEDDDQSGSSDYSGGFSGGSSQSASETTNFAHYIDDDEEMGSRNCGSPRSAGDYNQLAGQVGCARQRPPLIEVEASSGLGVSTAERRCSFRQQLEQQTTIGSLSAGSQRRPMGSSLRLCLCLNGSCTTIDSLEGAQSTASHNNQRRGSSFRRPSIRQRVVSKISATAANVSNKRKKKKKRKSHTSEGESGRKQKCECLCHRKLSAATSVDGQEPNGSLAVSQPSAPQSPGQKSVEPLGLDRTTVEKGKEEPGELQAEKPEQQQGRRVWLRLFRSAPKSSEPKELTNERRHKSQSTGRWTNNNNNCNGNGNGNGEGNNQLTGPRMELLTTTGMSSQWSATRDKFSGAGQTIASGEQQNTRLRGKEQQRRRRRRRRRKQSADGLCKHCATSGRCPVALARDRKCKQRGSKQPLESSAAAASNHSSGRRRRLRPEAESQQGGEGAPLAAASPVKATAGGGLIEGLELDMGCGDEPRACSSFRRPQPGAVYLSVETARRRESGKWPSDSSFRERSTSLLVINPTDQDHTSASSSSMPSTQSLAGASKQPEVAAKGKADDVEAGEAGDRRVTGKGEEPRRRQQQRNQIKAETESIEPSNEMKRNCAKQATGKGSLRILDTGDDNNNKRQRGELISIRDVSSNSNRQQQQATRLVQSLAADNFTCAVAGCIVPEKSDITNYRHCPRQSHRSRRRHRSPTQWSISCCAISAAGAKDKVNAEEPTAEASSSAQLGQVTVAAQFKPEGKENSKMEQSATQDNELASGCDLELVSNTNLSSSCLHYTSSTRSSASSSASTYVSTSVSGSSSCTCSGSSSRPGDYGTTTSTNSASITNHHYTMSGSSLSCAGNGSCHLLSGSIQTTSGASCATRSQVATTTICSSSLAALAGSIVQLSAVGRPSGESCFNPKTEGSIKSDHRHSGSNGLGGGTNPPTALCSGLGTPTSPGCGSLMSEFECPAANLAAAASAGSESKNPPLSPTSSTSSSSASLEVARLMANHSATNEVARDRPSDQGATWKLRNGACGRSSSPQPLNRKLGDKSAVAVAAECRGEAPESQGIRQRATQFM